MTNTSALKEAIKRSGYRISFIAEKLGLTYFGFKKKIDNESEFKASEIQKLCDLLEIEGIDKERIFFCG